jgi:hypothetical protein
MRPTKVLQHFMAERAHERGTIKIPGPSHAAGPASLHYPAPAPHRPYDPKVTT